jgi:hypothetical protein
MKTLESSTPLLFPETELELTSCQQVSPAKILALRESRLELGQKQEVGFGLNACDLLASYSQSSQSLRTSQTCLVAQLSNPEGGLALYSATWPKRGMMRNGQIYRLRTLVPGIGGEEFGYLPTPTKTADSKGAPKNRYYGSDTCRSNLREHLRDGPDDPVFPHPRLVEEMMGFPMCHTELRRSETQ